MEYKVLTDVYWIHPFSFVVRFTPTRCHLYIPLFPSSIKSMLYIARWCHSVGYVVNICPRTFSTPRIPYAEGWKMLCKSPRKIPILSGCTPSTLFRRTYAVYHAQRIESMERTRSGVLFGMDAGHTSDTHNTLDVNYT